MNKETLLGHVKNGLSIRQIARAEDTSFTNVRHWLRKYTLKTRHRPHAKGGRPGVNHKCPCGETRKEKFYGNKKSICGKCHNESVIRLGRQKRAKAVAYLGGKCSACGYSRFSSALEIHHPDPSKKDTSFVSMRNWCWERIEKEISTCVLLCRNCHAEHHGGFVADSRV